MQDKEEITVNSKHIYEDGRWLEMIMKSWTASVGTRKVMKMSSCRATKPGDNYMSRMYRAAVDLVDGRGAVSSKTMIIKATLDKSSGNLAELVIGAFRAEANVYNFILPKLEELCRRTPLFGEWVWADCYHASSNGIVMEDLKAGGYRLADRIAGLSSGEATFIMKSLARFHALSFYGVKVTETVPQAVLKPVVYVGEWCHTWISTMMTQLAQQMKTANWGPKWAEVGDKIDQLGMKMVSKLRELHQKDPDNLKVINHGDCWVNNIMMKYDEQTGHPVSIKFVDYQGSHYSSIGWDINYFLYSSLSTEMRLSLSDELLTVYSDSFRATLEALEGDPNMAPGVEAIKEEIDRLALFGLMTASAIAPVVMCRKEDAITPEELTQPSGGQFATKMYSNPAYMKYMMATLDYFIENKII